MRISVRATACAVVIFLSLALMPAAYCKPAAPRESLMRGASMSERDGFYILHLKGGPYQMGYQHGVLMKKQIEYLYNDYLINWLKEKVGGGIKFWFAYNMFKKNAAKMERYIPDEFREELRGIADGSGIAYQKVLIMHTFLDVVSHPKIVKTPVLTCTNFMTLNSASVGQSLIHGRNLSWPARGLLDKYSTIVFYEPLRGNKLCAMSWPGICGVLTGMNEKGVTIGETSVGSAESTLEGVPAFILFRSTLQYSDTMYDVIRTIGSNRRTTGYTLGVSDGKLRKACVIECTGWHYRVRFPKDDFLIGANHYLDPSLYETMKAVYPGKVLSDTNTFQRMTRMEELIRKNYGKIDGKTAEKFLGDPVMNTPGTFLSVVFEPERLTLSAAVGHDNIRDDKFLALDLKTELNARLEPEKYADPEKFYDYPKSEITETRTLAEQTKDYRKYQVQIPSGSKSEFLDSNIYLNYYEPKGRKEFPVIIILPHFTGSQSAIEGRFAERFAAEGMGAVVMDMAFQKSGRSWLRKQMKQGELITLSNLFREIIIDARRTLDWLETLPGVDTSRIGVMGISLGAIAAPVVCGTDTRVKAAAYVLGGGDLSTIIYNAAEAEFFRKRLDAKKMTPFEFSSRFSVVDPLTFAFRAKEVPSVMYNAMFDRLIPRKSTIQLWEALENPRMWMYPGGHYSAFLFIGHVREKVCRYFAARFRDEGGLVRSAAKEAVTPLVVAGS